MTLLPSPSLVSQGFSPRVVGPSRIAYRQGEVEILPLEKGLPLVVGEAPGQREDETGIGFHPEAEAGGLLTRLLQRVRVDRARLNFINVVQQRPPHNELYGAEGAILPWTYEAIEYWKPSLHAAIEELQPPVIIGLGRTALETLTGFQDIGTTRGYVCEARIDTVAGAAPCECVKEEGKIDPKCFLCDGEGTLGNAYERHSLHIPTISTYHPAFLNRGQHHLDGVFLRDVLAALEIGEKGYEETELRITPCPSIDDFRWFCRQYNPEVHKLTVDIENPDSRVMDEDELLEGKREISYEIDRMSFCYAEDIGGWSVPFEEPFIGMAKELLASPGPKRGHNCRLHDFPRLQSHRFVINGREYDTLDGWRHLHRGLANHAGVAFIAPFYSNCKPWKHEAHTQPEAYSSLDAIHQHRIAEGIERDLRATGQWDVYERHVVDIISTNHGICTQMSRNGLPIDAEKVEKFKLELEGKRGERQARLQELVPESIRKTKAYKGLNPQLRQWFKEHGTEPKSWIEHPHSDLQSLFVLRWQEPNDGEWYSYRLNGQWMRVYDFNPASHVQVKALIRHYGHKAKTDRKTKEDTTGDDTLKSLIGKYVESRKESDQQAVECYRLIRECRAIDKVLGTYVKGWKPASDGLIHATPGIWGDMFRISWRKPNLAATVADKKEIQIAAGFRTCICVPDDYAIVESDWKGMEALLVGFFADDPDYMRLARLGVHDFMGHHMMKLPIDLSMSDGELSERFKWFKAKYPKQRDDAKHTIHGVGYGMTAFLMAELYEMTRKRAQELIDLLFALFPKVKLWQQRTMQEAHDKCRLVNAWGYRMPFWQVFQWQQKRFERLRQLWVRFKTARNEPTLVVWTKAEQEWLHRIQNATDSGHVSDHDAIASLCYDLGDEAKSALAFLPRDTGAAMLKDTLLALRAEYGYGQHKLRCNAHDSIMAICRRSDVDEVAATLKSVMERPQTRLKSLLVPDGLVIGAEVSVGQSWDKKAMREWKGVESVEPEW